MRLLLTVSCFLGGGIAAAQSSGHCRIDSLTPLPTTFSPRSLAGFYDVQWHPAKNGSQRQHRRERLWLWPTSPSDSSRGSTPIRPAPDDTLTYPLFGTFVAANASVAAGDTLRLTVDPISPPVMLVAGWPRDTTHKTWPALVLLVGTIANREPNLIAMDGLGVGVQVRSLGTNGFEGIYDRWGIAVTDSGYFCAQRVH
jgi:hypothetical protein